MGSDINAKRNLYSFVSGFRKYYSINKYPISTVDICNKDETTKIVFHNFKTNGFCGAALPGNKIDTIILNSNRCNNELNFDCGHEIIHLTKHRDKCNDMFTCFDKKQNSFLEWEANEGSAELLLPYKLLLPILKDNWYLLNSFNKIYEFKTELSKHFEVPFSVVENRIENLKYETEQYLNGIPLEEIELLSNNQQKLRNIQVNSLNDIENLDFRKFLRLFKVKHNQ